MKQDREHDIYSEFQENVSSYLSQATQQRAEIRTSFMYMDCHRVECGYPAVQDTSVGYFNEPRVAGAVSGNRDERQANVHLLPSIIRGVAGSEVMKERHLDIVPIDDDDYNTDADVMDKGVSYAQIASSWKQAYDIATRDSLIGGVSATVSYLDVTKKDNMSGIPRCWRIYPLFLFYDTSGRGMDLNKSAKWCGYFDPMRSKDLDAYISSKLDDKKAKEISYFGGGSMATQFMAGLIIQDASALEGLFHYFWKEMDDVYDTQNPIANDADFQEIMNTNDIATEFMADWAKGARVDAQAPYWTLTKKQYKDLLDVLKTISKLEQPEGEGGETFEVHSSKRQVEFFYRAEIARGHVISYSESYSQSEFPLIFMTGYYDEMMNCFYGLCRPLSFVQDSLNMVMDDLLSLARKSVTGGDVYIKGAGTDIQLLKDSKANHDAMTPVSQNMEIIPKESPQAFDTVYRTATLLIDLMPRVIGVGQELLGVISSGDMTDSLFGRIVRQSFATLQDFANNSANASQRQGQLFMDMMISMAEVEDGKLLPVLMPGVDKDATFRLCKQNIARAYTIRVIERPVTDDERMENLKILMQIFDKAQASGINLMPVIIPNMRVEPKMREDLMKLAEPQPPAPPSETDVAMTQANIRLINANAAKLESDAAEKGSTLAMKPEQMEAMIKKDIATAILSMSKAGAEEHGSVVEYINQLRSLENDGREPNAAE